jgi:hypothetical protein
MHGSLKAMIRFTDGTEATYDTADHQWHAEDPELVRRLDLDTESLPGDYDRNPALGIAKAIADLIGAEVISADPVDMEDDSDPRVLFKASEGGRIAGRRDDEGAGAKHRLQVVGQSRNPV